MRKNNFIKRLQIAIGFLINGRGGVRIMTCGNCGSINILPVVDTATDKEISTELQKKNCKRIWAEVNICNNCGALVAEKQYWFWY